MDFENIGNLYSRIKELGQIYHKMSNIEMQKVILDLSEQALEMQNEILKLKEENMKLNQKEEITSKIERHKDAYITLNGSEQIYCATCWGQKGY